jgi:hypothetical protein
MIRIPSQRRCPHSACSDAKEAGEGGGFVSRHHAIGDKKRLGMNSATRNSCITATSSSTPELYAITQTGRGSDHEQPSHMDTIASLTEEKACRCWEVISRPSGIARFYDATSHFPTFHG